MRRDLEPGTSIRITHVHDESSDLHYLVTTRKLSSEELLKEVMEERPGAGLGSYQVMCVPLFEAPDPESHTAKVQRSRRMESMMITREYNEAEVLEAHQGFVDNCEMGLMEGYISAVKAEMEEGHLDG